MDGTVTSNMVLVGVPSFPRVAAFSTDYTDVIVDVLGYFAP
jgi:hypothetical protein